jgi:glycosyltransferase involved in cell wall biosynthesis
MLASHNLPTASAQFPGHGRGGANEEVNAFFRSLPDAIPISRPGAVGKTRSTGFEKSKMPAIPSEVVHISKSITSPLSMPVVPAASGLRTRRVIHIIKHCGYANGSVHVAVDLACIQAEAGCEVTFVSAGGTFVPLLEQYGVLHVAAPHEQSRPWDILSAARTVASLARRNGADVIHAHMMSSALVGYAASRAIGVPLVTTVHNSFDRHSALMQLGDKIVAVSDAERASLLAKGYRADKVTSVPNAPNRSPRSAFMKNDAEPVLEHPCIVTANALHRRKGMFDLLQACKELFADYPTWKLYIAGEGPDRKQLELQVNREGLQDRIHFLGFLPEPRTLLLQSDIFVLASYADPCSLAVGEARSAGCAIVATHVGGTPEMLDYGRAGLLVAPQRPDQLVNALRGLMQDASARRQLGEAAFKGSERFNVSRLLHDYDAVYQQAQFRPRRAN